MTWDSKNMLEYHTNQSGTRKGLLLYTEDLKRTSPVLLLNVSSTFVYHLMYINIIPIFNL